MTKPIFDHDDYAALKVSPENVGIEQIVGLTEFTRKCGANRILKNTKVILPAFFETLNRISRQESKPLAIVRAQRQHRFCGIELSHFTSRRDSDAR